MSPLGQYTYKKSLGVKSPKRDSLCTNHIFATNHFVVFHSTTGHGMAAVGSVGSGSLVIGFPVA